ncbi:MAG: NADH-quinone oxidoreductase subunit NuoE [Deltaproteobacteria bacterium]|nr:NADH-quinone oxidoreductase subunit NuoE [Deltaproteobacteria bacterium]
MLDRTLNKILSVFEGEKGDLISILQRVQEEFGYLPEDALAAIAEFLKLPQSQVFSVATFYDYFHLTRRGDHLICVCQGTACHVRGARDILEMAEKTLGIKSGQTTPDFKYSLDRLACVGSCALAPVVLVDDDVHSKMTMKKLKDVLPKDHDNTDSETH